jgi:hypothetical protein
VAAVVRAIGIDKRREMAKHAPEAAAEKSDAGRAASPTPFPQGRRRTQRRDIGWRPLPRPVGGSVALVLVLVFLDARPLAATR